MKNPFKNAQSVNEFFEMLRAELTELRGKRFRQWELSHVFIAEGHPHKKLSFALDADYTKGSDASKDEEASWLAIATGERSYYFHPQSRLGKGEGLGIDFGSSGGGSGKHEWSGRYFGTISLKYLPKLEKLLERNGKIDVERAKVQVQPHIYTAEEQKILDHADAIQHTKLKERSKLLEQFDSKYRKLDIYTGRPFR